MNSTKPTTDIFSAVDNDDLVALKEFIVEKKIPANSTTTGKRTAAHIAAKKNRLEIFKYLASIDVALIQTEDIYGYTPLFKAVEEGALDIVKYLVDECKVSVTQHNKRLYGNTPVHVAARAGQLEVLKYIVKSGNKVDVNAKNALGEPPCFLAVEEGHLEVIKFLAEETNADLTLTDKKKENIFSVCASKGDVKVAKYLLDERKLKFDINKKDGLGRTLVYLVAGLQNLDFLKYLVGEKRANINICDRLGRTPLHQAAMVGDIRAVRYLLEHGANPTTKDHDGKTPGASTRDHMMQKYLEKMAANHRTRRDVVDYHPKYLRAYISNPVEDGLQRNIATGRLLKSGNEVEQLEPASLQPINSLLTLLDIWVRCTRRSKYRTSFVPQEILKNRMDPLALFVNLEEFHIIQE